MMASDADRDGTDVGRNARPVPSIEHARPFRYVTGAFDAIVRTLLPAVCAGCGVSGHWLCPVCDEREPRIDLASVCRRCGSTLSSDRTCDRCIDWHVSLTASRSSYLFDGAVRQMIHKLKYRGEFARSEWCGRELARLVIELGWRPDLLVPVPLHASRMRSRGFNQSAKIAVHTSRLLSVPWSDALARTRKTVSQVGLDAEQRRENVDGAFACAYDLSGLAILLVDDVVTTGSTLEACAIACRIAGSRDIRAVTVATANGLE